MAPIEWERGAPNGVPRFVFCPLLNVGLPGFRRARPINIELVARKPVPGPQTLVESVPLVPPNAPFPTMREYLPSPPLRFPAFPGFSPPAPFLSVLPLKCRRRLISTWSTIPRRQFEGPACAATVPRSTWSPGSPSPSNGSSLRQRSVGARCPRWLSLTPQQTGWCVPLCHLQTFSVSCSVMHARVPRGQRMTG